jgi:hypothetical protein
MSLFGTARDASLIRHINRELINNIIEQQVGYYKIDLTRTQQNMYGEANGTKIYYDPVLINGLIERTPPTWTNTDFGPDVSQDITVRFLRDDLAGISLSTELPGGGQGFTYGIVPEVGDLVLWNDDFYEVDSTIENQLFVGKDPSYAYTDANGISDNDNFGSSISIIVNAHYSRRERLGITLDRL